MTEEKLKKNWQDFTEKNDFKLNPNIAQVNGLAKGVLALEKQYGLKLCPCRLKNGTRQRDLDLICPCNFKTHDTWESKGQCWCGLFVKS